MTTPEIIFHFDEGGAKELIVWNTGDFAHTDELGRFWAVWGDERECTTVKNESTPEYIKAHFGLVEAGPAIKKDSEQMPERLVD